MNVDIATCDIAYPRASKARQYRGSCDDRDKLDRQVFQKVSQKGSVRASSPIETLDTHARSCILIMPLIHYPCASIDEAISKETYLEE